MTVLLISLLAVLTLSCSPPTEGGQGMASGGNSTVDTSQGSYQENSGSGQASTEQTSSTVGSGNTESASTTSLSNTGEGETKAPEDEEMDEPLIIKASVGVTTSSASNGQTERGHDKICYLKFNGNPAILNSVVSCYFGVNDNQFRAIKKIVFRYPGKTTEYKVSEIEIGDEFFVILNLRPTDQSEETFRENERERYKELLSIDVVAYTDTPSEELECRKGCLDVSNAPSTPVDDPECRVISNRDLSLYKYDKAGSKNVISKVSDGYLLEQTANFVIYFDYILACTETTIQSAYTLKTLGVTWRWETGNENWIDASEPVNDPDPEDDEPIEIPIPL